MFVPFKKELAKNANRAQQQKINPTRATKQIVKYVATVRTRGHLNIVLEYIENGSLTANLKKFGNFSPPLVSLYTRQVLQGLAYLHSQGIIHRDIKGMCLDMRS